MLTLISQLTLSELAPCWRLSPTGCRGFTGPVPPPLWIRAFPIRLLTLKLSCFRRGCQGILRLSIELINSQGDDPLEHQPTASPRK